MNVIAAIVICAFLLLLIYSLFEYITKDEEDAK